MMKEEKKKKKRVKMKEQDPIERAKNFNEVSYGYSPEEAVEEASRCISCKRPTCKAGCPVGVDIPQFIALIKERKFLDACYKVKEKNLLPAVCGRVCAQEIQCEGLCIIGKKAEPVAIGNLERFVADYEAAECNTKIPHRPRPTGRKVAIIGSGPGGLTAAYFLSLEGYDVTVFEAKPVIGGMLRLALPKYRLPREALDANIEAIKEAGVKFQMNTALGKDISLNSLYNDGYKAIFISIGAHRSMELGIEGEETEGCLPSLKFLEAVNMGREISVGKRIGIIGGGNAAVDAARVANRLQGTEKVTLIYRRTRAEMPAFKKEVDAAIEEGIDIQFLTAPTKVFSQNGKLTGIECIHMELGEPDATGRRSPIPIKGSEFTIELNTLIKAIGERPDVSFLKEQGLKVSKRDTLVVDPKTSATSMPGVFAGGDAVTGPKTVIHAISAGKLAASSIDKYLKGESLQRQ